VTKSKAAIQAKLVCDRCRRTGDKVAGIFPFTYLSPYDKKNIEFKKHAGERMLCEDCFEYITDAMENLWPEKYVAPEVTVKQKDYTKP